MNEKTYKLDDPISVSFERCVELRADRIITSIPQLKDGKISFVMAEFRINDEEYEHTPIQYLIKKVVNDINESIKAVQIKYLENIIKEQNELENPIVFS